MEVLKTFRHEYKYVMPLEDTYALRERLDKVLVQDRNKEYLVRSLYFDSIDDIDYYSKQNGDIKRKKIRLRIYENNPDFAKIELKGKYDIHQLKESLVITREDAEELVKTNYEVLLSYNDDLAIRLYEMLKTGIYKPKVIIEYDRIAYITSTTTRITFDFNIKRSTDFDNFFNSNINYYSVTDSKDIVLEVKFDRFLEPYLSKILGNYVTRNQSVSKYVMGRNVL